jgi:hypothetical protein
MRRVFGGKGFALTVAVVLALIIVARARDRGDEAGLSALLIDDPVALTRLEEHGFSFGDVVGAKRLDAIAAAIADDMTELMRDAVPADPRRPFQPSWLTRGHFELVGVVNRLDRAPFDPPPSCGEVRLVYRLALSPQARPVTRMPMTVNVRIPQPRPGGDADCRGVARRWRSEKDVAAILRDLPPLAKVEINFQSVHIPVTRRGMDDSARYVLRAFKVSGDSLVPDLLFNTPRTDLSERERAELATWIQQNLDAIDRGTAVLPEKFLATRAVSTSPRGLAHLDNRPFSQLFPDATRFASPALRTRALVTTPELLLRRLDEATCQGCHQSRGVAGFHLLGEERDPKATSNALAVGRSPHLMADLEWRAQVLANVAQGKLPPSRPFAGHPSGAYGDPCGLVEGFASWTCGPGLACRDVHGADVGVCVPANGHGLGDPCQDARIVPSPRLEGALVSVADADGDCQAPMLVDKAGPACFPNELGFTGGLCTGPCAMPGKVNDRAICAAIPFAGFERDCMASLEPIETCLKRHSTLAWIPRCGADRACRDDYVCAHVPGAEPHTGGCIPPYFAFQIRVDGPRLDR